MVPDLAVEVVSPSDTAQELMDKVGEYLAAGVTQVWVVYPRPGLVYGYDSVEVSHIVGPNSVLDGGTILPGLRLPLKELFVFATIDERDTEESEAK